MMPVGRGGGGQDPGLWEWAIHGGPDRGPEALGVCHLGWQPSIWANRDQNLRPYSLNLVIGQNRPGPILKLNQL